MDIVVAMGSSRVVAITGRCAEVRLINENLIRNAETGSGVTRTVSALTDGSIHALIFEGVRDSHTVYGLARYAPT